MMAPRVHGWTERPLGEPKACYRANKSDEVVFLRLATMSRVLLLSAPCLLLLAGPAWANPAGLACLEGSTAAPERVIEDCDALMMDKTTAEGRLPGIFLARAEAFVRQGRLRLAIDDLANVISRRPDNAQAFLRRAELNRTLGQAEAAIADFSAAIRLEPKNAHALFARAELYRAKTDRRRALADYAAVMRIDPANEAASLNHKALALEIERQGAMMPVR
jgi:tetratricopeptide (TPR) repeat protein